MIGDDFWDDDDPTPDVALALDEAEFFEVEVDPADEERDIHEADEALEQELAKKES